MHRLIFVSAMICSVSWSLTFGLNYGVAIGLFIYTFLYRMLYIQNIFAALKLQENCRQYTRDELIQIAKDNPRYAGKWRNLATVFWLIYFDPFAFSKDAIEIRLLAAIVPISALPGRR